MTVTRYAIHPQSDSDSQGIHQRDIRVGETLITEAMIAQELQYHPMAVVEDAWQAAVNSLVIRELLNQRAAQLNIKTASEEERTALLLEQELAVPEPTEAQCLQYFKQNRQRFQTPVLLAISHILLPAAPEDEQQRDQQRQLAKQLLQQLQIDPQHFATLANQYSACPSAGQGGHLGQLSKGQTVAEFEQAVWRYPIGLIPQAVETRFGLHVVRIDQRVEGEPLDYPAVASRIRQYLHEQATRTALNQYLQRLSQEKEVEIGWVGAASA